mmetsp:Transcript_51426/g.92630  ORF Transcript_51426/g.92630 Transcript_51426/m.92630 type:complete len:143 (+) Transcript_51426:112-540(+)
MALLITKAPKKKMAYNPSPLLGLDLTERQEIPIKLLDGTEEVVTVDPLEGPLTLYHDGTQSWEFKANMTGRKPGNHNWSNPKWPLMSVTDKEVMLNIVAKKNKAARELFEDREMGIAAKQIGHFIDGNLDWGKILNVPRWKA